MVVDIDHPMPNADFGFIGKSPTCRLAQFKALLEINSSSAVFKQAVNGRFFGAGEKASQ
jgi:hypothetical protein